MPMIGRPFDEQRAFTTSAGLFCSATDENATASRQGQQTNRNKTAEGDREPLPRTQLVCRLLDGESVTGRSVNVARSLAGYEEWNGPDIDAGRGSTDRHDSAGGCRCRGEAGEARLADRGVPRGIEAGNERLSGPPIGEAARLMREVGFTRLREVLPLLCVKWASHIP